MADEQYLSSSEEQAPERLPMDSRFAQKMMRGGKGNPYLYVAEEQSSALRRYRPLTKWSKDERVVYNVMQSYIDKTGSAPTAGQIQQMSAGQGLSPEEGVAGVTGLSLARVQKALARLQKRGIVFQMV